MISYNKALKLMEQNIKVSKKSEKVNIFLILTKESLQTIFHLKKKIQNVIFQQWMG